jgi:hypothetical protein
MGNILSNKREVASDVWLKQILRPTTEKKLNGKCRQYRRTANIVSYS